jgi:hypothetical protein
MNICLNVVDIKNLPVTCTVAFNGVSSLFLHRLSSVAVFCCNIEAIRRP